jgi:DNA-binding NarL/FixJ family response regulator
MGLQAVLRGQDDLVPVGVAASPFELCPLLKQTAPDVILLDYHLELEIKDYKGGAQKNRDARAQLIDKLVEESGWLLLDDAQRDLCVAKDHYLDALVCALVARAASVPLLDEPVPEGDELRQAQREGWVYLPAEGSLSALGEA